MHHEFISVLHNVCQQQGDKMKLVHKHTIANLILSRIVVCAMVVFLYSCGGGGGGDGSSGTGSVAFSLALRDSTADGASINRQLDDDTSPIECVTDKRTIDTIEAQVIDINEEILAEGGPFDCEDGQGDIDDVAAGANRKVKVSAKTPSGIVICRGKRQPHRRRRGNHRCGNHYPRPGAGCPGCRRRYRCDQ